jgi:hypothetical protein
VVRVCVYLRAGAPRTRSQTERARESRVCVCVCVCAAVAWGNCHAEGVFVRVLYLLRACLAVPSADGLTPFLHAVAYVLRAPSRDGVRAPHA